MGASLDFLLEHNRFLSSHAAGIKLFGHDRFARKFTTRIAMQAQIRSQPQRPPTLIVPTSCSPNCGACRRFA
jgi:hypothetical protein